jgi:3-deoxy-manno-octulosonate cytidylyltransferase (CMP-KDO synthetase)
MIPQSDNAALFGASEDAASGSEVAMLEKRPASPQLRTAIVIPARYASSRYPGKPLVALRGAGGGAKSLIQRSWEAAQRTGPSVSVHVATDDERIAREVESFGGSVLMTPASCRNGTERVAACLDQLDAGTDLVVNFQGDALLTPPDMVSDLISHMVDTPDSQVATPAIQCAGAMRRHLLEDAAAGRVGGTTVVTNAAGQALYFSKQVLPYQTLGDLGGVEPPPVLIHVGLYAYRLDALRRYVQMPITELEQREGLEQLRFLFHGVPMDIVVAQPPRWTVVELNNPEDVRVIEATLREVGIE